MAGARPFRNRKFASDYQLGGRTWVLTDRDRGDGEPFYRVAWVSAGGDIYFKSLPMKVLEHAEAACRVFAQFVGAVADEAVRGDVSRAASASDLAAR
jgi:hypothetical protein